MVLKSTEKNEEEFTKLQYEKTSRQLGLPPRCPLIYECKRAKGTRWLLSREGSEKYKAYEYQLTRDENYEGNPEIHLLHNITYPKEFLTDISNACPEVIFEKYGVFASSYEKYKDYDMDGKIITSHFETTGKHFSECHEFAKYCMRQKIPLRQREKEATSFNEKKIEDYLINALDRLENGLRFVGRQKSVVTGRVDIVAKDASGNNVFIELKAKLLSLKEMDTLCGQVSRYYNESKTTSGDSRMFIVIPRIKKRNVYKLYQGLKHWITSKQVRLYHFDYNGKDFSFSENVFENL